MRAVYPDHVPDDHHDEGEGDEMPGDADQGEHRQGEQATVVPMAVRHPVGLGDAGRGRERRQCRPRGHGDHRRGHGDDRHGRAASPTPR